MKERVKVTFNDQPEINRIGDDYREKGSSSMKRAIITTNGSSKAESSDPSKRMYQNEEAKNLYNGMMIRNYKMQMEVNAYARYYRIQNMRKQKVKKELEESLKSNLKPIVIFDGDDYASGRKSSIKTFGIKHKEQHEAKKVKEKPYAFKYQVLKVRCGEFIRDGSHNNIGVALRGL